MVVAVQVVRVDGVFLSRTLDPCNSWNTGRKGIKIIDNNWLANFHFSCEKLKTRQKFLK